MGVGLPVCLNPAYPHGMTLWGSEGAECDCEGNGPVKIYAQNYLQAPAE